MNTFPLAPCPQPHLLSFLLPFDFFGRASYVNVPYDFCPQIESNGRNVYTCFHCGFTLCARCMRLQFGRFSTRRSSRIRETDVQIGDEVLKLPPKYEEITRLSVFQRTRKSLRGSLCELVPECVRDQRPNSDLAFHETILVL